jgi:hypothetical protein
MKRITIPPEADTLRLRLELPADDYPAYRAEFQTAEGRTIYINDILKSGGADGRRLVEPEVPSEILNAGDYQLRLYGLHSSGDVEPLGRYYFRISAQ